MTESPHATPVGPRTKGLALPGPSTLEEVTAAHPTTTADTFSWPLLTLDDDAVEHNLATMAGICRAAGVQHAPHVKTTMSPQLYARQVAHGAWGATVANPAQLRTVVDWGARRVFLANELVDPREAAALRRLLEAGSGAGAGDGLTDGQPLEVWLYVDSAVGVQRLAEAFADADPQVRARLGVLVEVGVAGGRTGARGPAQQATRGRPPVGRAPTSWRASRPSAARCATSPGCWCPRGSSGATARPWWSPRAAAPSSTWWSPSSRATCPVPTAQRSRSTSSSAPGRT